MLRKRGWIGLVVLSTLAGCDTDLPTEAEVPLALAISDGANGGNPHFFFLNPLVPNPSPMGTFDPSLEPEVEICPLDAQDVCGAAIAIFTTEAGHASETVRMSESDEHYVVNWHSADFDLDPDVTYRIRVLVNGRELGFGDVDVVTSGNQLKNVATDEYIPLKDGRTLPIKFRIEDGALTAVQPNALAAGRDHACVLDETGAAFCWGDNAYGQLGNGSLTASTTPVPVAGGLTFVAIETSQYTTCGVTPSGDGYCWGFNQWGQIGTGTAGGVVTQPSLVVGGQSWQSLAPAYEFTCGIAQSGAVWCWGNNTRGSLGRGFFSSQEPTPAPVVGGDAFTLLTADRAAVCGVLADGTARCWGGNNAGRLGDGTFVNRNEPTVVAGGLLFSDLDSGGAHTCGVTLDGAGYCWGRNDFGELGTGTSTTADLPTPQAMTGGHDFALIRAGFGHSCGLTTTGEAWCWGVNTSGQLGIGVWTGIQPTPLPVFGSRVWELLDTGYNFTCARTTGGDLYCWGENAAGTIGDGTTADRYSPVRVQDGSGSTPAICGNFLEFAGGVAGLPSGWTHDLIDFPPLVGATPLAGGRMHGQRTNSGERVTLVSTLPVDETTTFTWQGSFRGSVSGQFQRITLWDSFGNAFYTVVMATSDFLHPRNPNPTLILRVDLPGPVIVQENLFELPLGGVLGEAAFTPSGVDLTMRRADGNLLGSAFLAEPIDYSRIHAVSFDVYETDGDGVNADKLAITCLGA